MAKAKKLPSGSWRVQASVTVDGKRIVKSFTADTAKKAELAALEWQTDRNHEKNIDNITLKEAFERYIKSKENVLSPGTVRIYKVTANSHLQSIQNIKISNLTTEIIQRAINIEAATHSPNPGFPSVPGYGRFADCFQILPAAWKLGPAGEDRERCTKPRFPRYG